MAKTVYNEKQATRGSDQFKIAIPETHPNFQTMEEVEKAYNVVELVEIVNRYVAAQITARKARLNMATRAKAMKAKFEALAAAEGKSLDEFLSEDDE